MIYSRSFSKVSFGFRIIIGLSTDIQPISEELQIFYIYTLFINGSLVFSSLALALFQVLLVQIYDKYKSPSRYSNPQLSGFILLFIKKYILASGSPLQTRQNLLILILYKVLFIKLFTIKSFIVIIYIIYFVSLSIKTKIISQIFSIYTSLIGGISIIKSIDIIQKGVILFRGIKVNLLYDL